jgi:DNA-binding protein Fis
LCYLSKYVTSPDNALAFLDVSPNGDPESMDKETYPFSLTQPTLFNFSQTTRGAIELFPEVWGAMEELISSKTSHRHAALDRLLKLNAPRLSALVAYLLATRITDPDLTVRIRVIRVIGDIYTPDERSQPLSDSVKSALSSYLAQIDSGVVSSLIEASIYDASLFSHVARLLNYCPNAASHLVEILMDRKASLEERRLATELIGRVGFLEAVPALERLYTKLGARIKGQQSMPFAPPPTQDEAELLPVVEKALSLLQVR